MGHDPDAVAVSGETLEIGEPIRVIKPGQE